MSNAIGRQLGDFIVPGSRIFVPGATGEPQGLLDQMALMPDLSAGTTYVQFPIGGLNTTDFSAWHRDARVEAFFMSPALRSGFAEGRVDFLPMHMRRVFDHIGNGPTFDVVLVQAARDAEGVLRHTFNLDFLPAALANTRSIVVQENSEINPPSGAPAIDEAGIALILEVASPVPEMQPAPLDDAAEAIGALVAELIPDGACIQTGIGAIPQAILAALSEHNDLGMHGGLIDDAGLALIHRGVITGVRKRIDQGSHIAGIAMGTGALYQALADAPSVVFKPANYTHEVGVISQLDDFVSINSAVEIDLFGQVSAEMVAGRQISGTGGSVDFMRGAAASNGGLSIVALNATAKAGQVSRIVPALREGSATTAARTDIDLVVTEYGVAKLKGGSVDSRAQALIDIAAPDFRDELRESWRERRRAL